MTGLDLDAAIRTVPARRRRPARPRALRYGLLAVASVAALLVVIGFAFSGSSGSLPEGARVAGVDVGGLSPPAAQRVLEQRARELRRVPVVFTVRDRRFAIRPSSLSLEADWAGAVEAARRQGEGLGPVQGLRRIGVRVLGTDVSPAVDVYEPALERELKRMSTAIDDPGRDAAIRLRGLEPQVVKGREGVVLDREAAARVIARSLAGLDRRPVALPMRIDRPTVRAADLAAVATQVKTAVSTPVRLTLGRTTFRIPRWRIAQLLALPGAGRKELAIAGPAAEAYLDRLSRRVRRKPRSAGFAATPNGDVRVVPGRPGRELRRAATAEAVLAAALSPRDRNARAVVAARQPALTTAEARGLGIKKVLAEYSTAYAGTADRIHNLRLAVSILDGALVPPGATFSLNRRLGERTAERGFRTAPVIMNDEYEEAIGGGVSQVATTVFNAAWEAGLKIAQRVPHSLYISRYPLGRDATVNYPDLDLKFVNDTRRWLLIRGSSDASGITVAIYGARTGRRVVSEAGSLVVTGPTPVERSVDRSLPDGTTVVDASGIPPQSVTVTRTVYEPDGSVRARERWYSSYRAEPKIVRVGARPQPKPKPKPKPGPKPKEQGAAPTPPGTTTTTPGTTTTTPERLLPQP